MKFITLLVAALFISISGVSQGDATLSAQKITAIDTTWDGLGIVFTFREGEKLEGCNSNQVLIKEGPQLDGILAIGMSAHFANRKVQFRVHSCSDGMMLGKAISLSNYYNPPGTRFTIPSNLTKVTLASLIDPNSAGVFIITVDHITTLRGAVGETGTTGATGPTGSNNGTRIRTGNSRATGRGGVGGVGLKGGTGGTGGWAIDLAGFSGKKVTILNIGSIISGQGGMGGKGGTGGTGGRGAQGSKGGVGDRCVGTLGGYGGTGGKGGPAGNGGIAGEAIANSEDVELVLAGNSILSGQIGNMGTSGNVGTTGAVGPNGYYCWYTPQDQK
ncbi:MAG: hypothetical protein OFPI_27220 [Osedax symbiont Rs2]|nr:MAG: hypothetical protein OFPI_27220 [Osedax symbiont Rs2]